MNKHLKKVHEWQEGWMYGWFDDPTDWWWVKYGLNK